MGGILDNKNSNDFELGKTDTYTLSNLKDVGTIGCIYLLGDDKIGYNDEWLPKKVEVSSDSSETKTFVNKDQLRLGSKTTYKYFKKNGSYIKTHQEISWC